MPQKSNKEPPPGIAFRTGVFVGVWRCASLSFVDDLEAAGLVDLVEEIDATLVTAALELGIEPLVDDHLGELGAHDAGAKGEHRWCCCACARAWR